MATGEALECEGARSFEHAVSSCVPGVGDHERLVHERTEVIEHRPLVDHIVGGELLRGFEREAAREDTKSVEYPLFRFRQQAVAPLQRGTQCLVLAQCQAEACGQQPKAFVEPFAHAVDAE